MKNINIRKSYDYNFTTNSKSPSFTICLILLGYSSLTFISTIVFI